MNGMDKSRDIRCFILRNWRNFQNFPDGYCNGNGRFYTVCFLHFKIFWKNWKNKKRFSKRIFTKSFFFCVNFQKAWKKIFCILCCFCCLILYIVCFARIEKKLKKYQKNLKNFRKKYWQKETYMIYYMSARRKGAKNNGPWKLNNNKLNELNSR